MAKRGATLSIDIGGSGLKMMVLDREGVPVNERHRVATPRPARPKAVLKALLDLVEVQPSFDRVSVGFPGVVVDNTIMSAPNLDGEWTGFPLAREIELRTERMVRIANDADVQGLGAIEGEGVEMVLTLGTGMGSALFVDGKLVPNLELGHHVFHKRTSYEEYVGNQAFKKVGLKRWSKRVLKVVETIQPIWNPHVIYLGGGNAKRLKIPLPSNIRVVSNIAGLIGGVRLWEHCAHS
ncbi:MAG: ROK family protein [Myxococcota bacterium]